MKQSLFVARYGEDWRRFEAWLDAQEKFGNRRKGRTTRSATTTDMADRDVPAAYRRLCQHLALARERQYSAEIVDRLNDLALRGHHALYGARHRGGRGWRRFVLTDFPRLVRAEGRLVIAAALLFYGPLVALTVLLQQFPEFVHYLLDERQLGHMREMYDPANLRLGMREADTNLAMFAHYIWNNIKIGFQTFATGMAFGLGSLFFLIYNGLILGAVAGYLTAIGYGTPFWAFVSGHSALELTAIVISGAAGLKLGMAAIAPGLLTRKAALVAAARVAVRLMYGAALMFAAAALVEAFWSPHTLIPPAVKYAVGLGMWIVVLSYLLYAGRARRLRHAA